MNEKLTVKEVRQRIGEYFSDARANISVSAFGMRIAVEIKYWDFKPEREVRHDIEAISEDIDIMEMERFISDESLSKSMMDLIEQDTKVYYQDGDTLRMTSLMEIITTHARTMTFEKLNWA